MLLYIYIYIKKNSSENKQDKQNKGPIVGPSEVHFREMTHPDLDCG